MKAIAARWDTAKNALTLSTYEAPDAALRDREIRVRVEAVSVNPVDFKVASRLTAASPGPTILGWDAAGVVTEVGPNTQFYKVGDEVFYAGSVDRPGTNCDLHVVDERIVGKKPKSLSFPEAAAMPLTAITAWEGLFHRLQVPQGEASRGKSVLLVAGAGGVGSIAIQLLKKLTEVKVIATATRPESIEWVKSLGADYVIRHDQDFVPQLQEQKPPPPDYIFCLQATDEHFARMADAVRSQGRIASIVEPKGPLPMGLLFGKSASFHWELMFTRPLFQTDDREEQKKLLDACSVLVDEGKLRSTIAENLGRMTAATITQAHDKLRTLKTVGKIVLEKLG